VKYRLLIKKVALKNLEKLPYNAIASINDKIVLLENDPRPPDCKKLKTYDNVYRVKVGNYRYYIQLKMIA
jgi:mRNA interferase RelE/StbE